MTNKLSAKHGALMIGAALTAYLGYQTFRRSWDASQLAQETLDGAISNVSITHARPGPTKETIILPGNIDAWYQAPIYAQVSGYVKMWYKDYGALVKKGDVLAEINAPMVDAQFAQARAAVQSQKAKYNLAVVTAQRYLALRKSRAVSEQSISVQEANEKSEAADVEAAEHNLDNFLAQERFKTIVAPFDGVVISRNINVGDYVNKDGSLANQKGVSEMFSVADIHKMRLFVSVPETFSEVLRPGLTAEVVVPQFPDRRFKAQFLTSANGFDPITRTAITEFTIDNEDRALWPGSYGEVFLTVSQPGDTLIIPSSALVFQEAGTEVALVRDDNTVHFQPIAVGRILDGVIEVKSGVTRADRIIQTPSAALLEGDAVRVVTPAKGYVDKAMAPEAKKTEPAKAEAASPPPAPAAPTRPEPAKQEPANAESGKPGK